MVLAVNAAAVVSMYAPPAIFLPVLLHFQMPVATLFTHSYKQSQSETWIVTTYLAGEGTDVLGSLGDFKLLHDLSEGCTVAVAILSANSYLLCSLCHYYI